MDARCIWKASVFPRGTKEHAPPAIAEQAYDAIDAMAKGHDLTVAAIAPKEDRYDRVRGQVFSDDNPEPWLQMALIRSGMVRVDIAPDRGECAAELYAAEGQARVARAGLWALPPISCARPRA